MPMISDFLSQASARLGPALFDTSAERLFWQAAKSLAKHRRPLVLLGLLTIPQMGDATLPVLDYASLQNAVQQYSAQGIRDRTAQLWKESKDEARWVTDLVESYRTIKIARASYESLATFDLAQNVSVIDLVPEVDLPAGQYFGSDPLNPTTDANGNVHYVSLRFKTNPVGGISNTLDYSTIAKFHPKLRINVDQLANQLANLDFDALQMVQYRGPNGELIDKPINVGQTVATRLAWWDKTLRDANDWVGQKLREDQTLNDLKTQQVLDAAAYQEQANRLKAQADKADADLRARLQGQAVAADIPSTYDQIYAPGVQLQRQLLAAQQAEERAGLKSLWDRLSAIKATEERRQAAVQSDAQVTEILAQEAQIQQNLQIGYKKILDKYKVQRQDPGESAGGGLLTLVNLSSTDLQNMKLPPPAREELERLMKATADATQVLMLKLNAQKQQAENLSTINGVTKDLAEMTQAMTDARWAGAASSLTSLQRTLQQLDDQRIANNAALQGQLDQEAAAQNAAILQNFSDANNRFFGYMLTKKPISGAAFMEGLLKTYGDLLKTFVGGRSLADVMGPKFAGAKNDWQAEQNLYSTF